MYTKRQGQSNGIGYRMSQAAWQTLIFPLGPGQGPGASTSLPTLPLPTADHSCCKQASVDIWLKSNANCSPAEQGIQIIPG